MVTQGKKQVREAVLIAALSTLVSGVIGVSVDLAKDAIERKRKQQGEEETPKQKRAKKKAAKS